MLDTGGRAKYKYGLGNQNMTTVRFTLQICFMRYSMYLTHFPIHTCKSISISVRFFQEGTLASSHLSQSLQQYIPHPCPIASGPRIGRNIVKKSQLFRITKVHLFFKVCNNACLLTLSSLEGLIQSPKRFF